MKIYLASSWKNELQPFVLQILAKAGNEVYDFRNPAKDVIGFSWSKVSDFHPNLWTMEDCRKALEHPEAIAAFETDFMAMMQADACVLLLPCGRSAHVEAGWMKAAGKKVYVYMQEKQEPELMYKIFDDIVIGIDELKRIAAFLAAGMKPKR